MNAANKTLTGFIGMQLKPEGYNGAWCWIVVVLDPESRGMLAVHPGGHYRTDLDQLYSHQGHVDAYTLEHGVAPCVN